MAAHETKICERCGSCFECKVGNITQCQCYAVPLTEAEKQYIGKEYADCLCANCLVITKNELAGNTNQ